MNKTQKIEKDKRNCECGERMKEKGIIQYGEEYPDYLWQCPKCKNIEILEYTWHKKELYQQAGWDE